MIDTIKPKKLKEEMDKGTAMIIVDLQTPDKYTHSHVPGAVNLPIENFTNEYSDVLKDQTLSVILYGEFDELGKGSQAAEILSKAGFTQVGHIEGGLHGWKNAGFPTEGGQES